MNEASITKAICESLLAMEQGSEYELVAAIQFLSAVELAHELHYHVAVVRDHSNRINVLLKRDHDGAFVELTPREHEVTVSISWSPDSILRQNQRSTCELTAQCSKAGD